MRPGSADPAPAPMANVTSPRHCPFVLRSSVATSSRAQETPRGFSVHDLACCIPCQSCGLGSAVRASKRATRRRARWPSGPCPTCLAVRRFGRFQGEAIEARLVALERLGGMNEPIGPTALRPKRLRRQTPYPIAEAPPVLMASGRTLLLLCGPDQGGWRLGSWREGAWRDADHRGERLEPSHFALASGWRSENGRWLRTASKRRLIVCISGGIALAWIAMLSQIPQAGRDLWALCAASVGQSGSFAWVAPRP